jgi:small conductance mechanosensitive channel
MPAQPGLQLPAALRRPKAVFDVLKILEEILAGHESILKEPEPVVKVHELPDSSVNFVVRPWVATDNCWDVYWDITGAVKDRFAAEGVSLVFPQRDVPVN